MVGYNQGMTLGEGERRAAIALLLPSLACILLFAIRVGLTDTSYYWFLMENLVLAWTPLLFGWLLVRALKTRSWYSPICILWSVVWLLMLPNSWYVLTDYVHAVPTGQISELYDITLITSLVMAGFAVGYTSLFMIHRQLLLRLRKMTSAVIVFAVLLASSFAIYLGRDLRWSSWDVVADPAGITLDISDRLIHPFGYPKSWNMTGTVFVLLAGGYGGFYLWQEQLLGSTRKRSKN